MPRFKNGFWTAALLILPTISFSVGESTKVQVRVEAEVLEYREYGFHFDMQSGPPLWFDLTFLKISEPSEFQGEKRSLLIKPKSDADGILKEKGSRVEIEVEPARLEPSGSKKSFLIHFEDVRNLKRLGSKE